MLPQFYRLDKAYYFFQCIRWTLYGRGFGNVTQLPMEGHIIMTTWRNVVRPYYFHTTHYDPNHYHVVTIM